MSQPRDLFPNLRKLLPTLCGCLTVIIVLGGWLSAAAAVTNKARATGREACNQVIEDKLTPLQAEEVFRAINWELNFLTDASVLASTKKLPRILSPNGGWVDCYIEYRGEEPFSCSLTTVSPSF